MSTYSLELAFLETQPDEGVPMVIANVAVKTSTSRNGFQRLVSHDCAGPTELRAEVARLKNELDSILREGVRRFERHRQGLSG